jgi:hypothetical protein
MFRIKQLGFSVELREKWSDDEHHRASLVMRRRSFEYIRTENLAVGVFLFIRCSSGHWDTKMKQGMHDGCCAVLKSARQDSNVVGVWSLLKRFFRQFMRERRRRRKKH